ncbi:GHKL domain-containing protein [Domibacillus sp. DTU_2020_1001157_1_SI_ALB_TIR_016]|uniref:sensor histidine kinase n=1 Tax=Domibacillus sp. DTU_2020_1001157_1_SI_ALB_TIR_016 TaxID=3077789 RepID=UPI0028EC7331|nr:GHKL domain-containing protein [Domibacillus sp. DTU_2020_1001157_1_SI_ALB_TIR_016]WNS80431.1 GHKL domain-containing protein [Domibacillus sp. DTU_2020_1001157_1_SI_ALB_TIR_016]
MSFLFFILFTFTGVASVYWRRRTMNYRRQVMQLEQEREKMNKTFLKVRSERHDFLKHIAALQYMFDQSQHDEAKKYMDELIGGYEETNLSIKGESGAVAGILHDMYRRAKQAGVEVVYDLDVPLSSLPLPDQEIVRLAGNLVANSIEASDEWQKKRGRHGSVVLQLSKRSGLFLLSCQNNCLPIPNEVVDHLFTKSGISTKGEEHAGLGTKIIREAVRAACGYLDFIHKEETFTVKIKIPAIVTKEMHSKKEA